MSQTCPRCQQLEVSEPSCPRCGVVFAKLAPRLEPGASARPPSPPAMNAYTPASRSGGASWPWLLLAGAALAGGVALVWPRSSTPPAQAASIPPAEAPRQVPIPAGEMPPPPTFPAAEALTPQDAIDLAAAGLPAPDLERARSLASSASSAGSTEVQQAEELYARYPGDSEVRQLLQSVLIGAAQRARSERRRDQAVAWIQRAAAVARDAAPWLALTQVLTEAGDWAGAEAAARGAIALEPRNFWAWQALGYALLRQDRSRDAAEALETALSIQEDSGTRALLTRVHKGLQDESGMTQQALSHFNVRYDGEAHEGVGREILRALERHYATLAGTFDHQPAGAIPVILFTQQGYYDASGAPAWSGGAYDTLDGRIRIPIGGLTPSLTADIDDTLVHELTHAFIADRTRGVASRDLHEGLAQYMEGKRSESLLGREGLRALADGQMGGVRGFYVGALSFAEYLVANRGMGGMNELLRAMGETGSVDQAFRQVHNHSHDEMQRLWIQRLKQQYGS